MDVLYANCAGLDFHKDTVVACSRRMIDGQSHPRGSHLHDDDERASRLVGLARIARRNPHRDGGDRRLLEAGLEYPERWRFRVDFGQRGVMSKTSRAERRT